MISVLKLIRFQNLLMVLLTLVLTRYALLQEVFILVLSTSQFIILTVSILSITAGGYIVNDILDLKADLINKPQKVVINHKVTSQTAWVLYGVCNSIGLSLGTYISITLGAPLLSLIFWGSAIGLYWYSSTLKRWPLVGNLMIAFLVALTIITLYIFETSTTEKGIRTMEALTRAFGKNVVQFPVVVYIVFSFLTTLIREILKDLEDINGDYAMHMQTLPILLGRKRTRAVALLLSIVLLILLIFITKEFVSTQILFLGYVVLLIILPLTYFIYTLWNAQTQAQYHYLSQFMKWLMCLGIVSMLFFKLL